VDAGLPGRNWYKNLSRYTGYAPKTLPGVREAIEEERWADADRYAALTGAALDALRGQAGPGRTPDGRSWLGRAGAIIFRREYPR
jgi:N-acetylated-alpha-linked acidic dipeptidase